jgi:hypothetical protein
MKPFTNKHSIAAGSPIHMGGSGKSPLYQDDLREGDFKVTQSTTGLSGEDIATERQAVIPGQEVERLAQPGTPEYARWEAAVTKDPSIEDKYKDRTVTQTRNVEVNQPKLRKNIFKGYRGNIPDEIKQADSLSFQDQVGVAKPDEIKQADSLSFQDQVGVAKSLNMDPGVFQTQYEKVTGRKINKNPKTKITRKPGSQSIGDWTTIN